MATLSNKSFLFFIFFGLFYSFFAQNEKPSPLSNITNEIQKSNIKQVFDSDTSLIKVEIHNGSYNSVKNYLPFYALAKTSSYDEKAIPNLTIKKTSILSQKVSDVIIKYYSKFINSEFQIEAKSSLCKNENLNHYQLIPFRINKQNQIEELVDYEISWLFQPMVNAASRTAANFTSTSVLANGDWFKIGLTESGVYKISKEFLINIGMNVNNINPKNIHIFGNGGKMLAEKNQDFRYDDLQENAITIIGEEDGKFDNLDYILFYANGPDTWKINKGTGLKFKVTKNLYSDSSFYFITFNNTAGKRINQQNSLAVNPIQSSSSYDYYNFHEENLVNFGKSGRDFYGEYFDFIKSYQFKWNDNDFVINDSIFCDVSMVAINGDSSNFLVTGNGIRFIVTTGSMAIGQTHEDFAKPGYNFGKAANNFANEIAINIEKLTSKSIGYLDKVTINARRKLVVSEKQFCFRDSRTIGLGKNCQFNINISNNANFVLFDVTDPINVKEQKYFQNGENVSFISGTDSLNEYCIASPNNYYVPSFVGKVPNQNLHNIQQADYLIITHPLFLKEAAQMGLFHQQKDGLSYQVATTDQIYNEFSSGNQDVSAIRDFIRMVYSRNIAKGTQVKYVLLIGDGSYVNKNRNIVNNSNFIPTYQSINTLGETQTLATDDFYGLMDPDEGQNAENYGSIDIGIGRFTCKSNAELKAIMDKIFNYYQIESNFQINPKQNTYSNNESVMGDWRNNLLFLADDDDAAEHMKQSNSITSLATSIDRNFNIDKVFLDAYQRFSTAGGARYPDASLDFIKKIQKGVLVFNYTGHGGEVGLTAERIIDVDIINNLSNFNKLPLFVTATCEFSRYDDPGRTSAGELCLLNAKGGAIALFTTCRLAYSGPNFTLNSILISNLLNKLPNGSRPKLGDIVQMTKSDSRIGQSYVYSNFHLLGDPALTLAYPKEKVYTNIVNNKVVTNLSADTLSALAKITVSGYVGDNSGNKLTNFNGVVYPTVFDKEQEVVCLKNVDGSAINYPLAPTATVPLLPFKYKSQKNILYRGKSQVTNGNFSFTFMVPKDISFAYGPGRISYYATNGTADASGSHEKLVVGGASKNIYVDNEGPQVNLFMNDESFVNGGLTNEKPVMFADLVDSSGINTVGNSIGHDISIVLDAKSNNPIILNDYYESSLDSYQKGRVRYPFDELSEGQHNIAFKVWDIQNNSNTVYTDFVVAPSAEIALKEVMNYPNPFTTHTQFIFQHNQTCVPLKVTVQIYTVSGKNIKTIQQSVSCDSGKSQSVEWDGKDDFGQRLGRGVYIYKLAIINPENKKAEKIEKLVILN